MNHIYRIVFNHTLGIKQVVAECAKAAGKSSATSVDGGPKNWALRGMSGAFLSAFLGGGAILIPKPALAVGACTANGCIIEAGENVTMPGGEYQYTRNEGTLTILPPNDFIISEDGEFYNDGQLNIKLSFINDGSFENKKEFSFEGVSFLNNKIFKNSGNVKTSFNAPLVINRNLLILDILNHGADFIIMVILKILVSLIVSRISKIIILLKITENL